MVNKNILIISAHADDHVACAGTIFKLVDSGCIPYEIVLTKSNEGPNLKKSAKKQNGSEITSLRNGELDKASKFLGIKKIFFLNQDDLGLTYSKNLMLKVAKIIRKVKPSIGIVMNSFDSHPDHKEAYKTGSEAFRWANSGVKPVLGNPWKTPTVLCAEGMIPIPANILVDITLYADKKVQLWKMYDSQATPKSVKFEEGLMQVRGYQLRKQNGLFAEAFTTDPNAPILLFEDE